MLCKGCDAWRASLRPQAKTALMRAAASEHTSRIVSHKHDFGHTGATAEGCAVLGLARRPRAAAAEPRSVRDRPTLVQEELWRCAVRSRWPWACVDGWFFPSRYYTLPGRAWITACGSWRRAYAVSANHRLRRNPVVTVNAGGRWMNRSRRRYESRGRRPITRAMVSVRQTRRCRGSRNVPGRKSRWSKRAVRPLTR